MGNSSAKLTPDLTLRQVVQRYPGTQRVLARHPRARIGGSWSLQELWAFARDEGVATDQLLAELAAAAGVGADPSGRSVSAPGLGAGVGAVKTLLVALVVSLTVGAGWGVVLLLRIAFAADYQAAVARWVHLHGVEQLWGWVGLTIFGVASYLLRQTAKSKPPAALGLVSRGLLILGLVLVAASMIFSSAEQYGRIMLAGSGCLLAASVLFCVEVLWDLSGKGLDVGHLFILAATQWLLVWAAADLVIRWRFRMLPAPPEGARTLLIVLPVLGFMANMILGFGIRLIPGFLNITRLRHRAWLVAAIAYNAGLIGLVATPWPVVKALGAALMWAGVWLYLVGMNWTRATVPGRPIAGVDPRGGVLIRVALFWLVVGVGMLLGQMAWLALGLEADGDAMHKFAGAYRHALTVGFVTTMILGIGQRLIPVFLRQQLATPGVMRVAAWLIIVGNAWRVVCELLTIGEWPEAYRAMGVSGLLELGALVLFGLSVVRTMAASRRRYARGEPVTASTRVRELVNAYPQTVVALQEMGIGMLEQTPFVAPSMTVGGLALAEGVDVGAVVAKLEAAREDGPEEAGLSKQGT